MQYRQAHRSVRVQDTAARVWRTLPWHGMRVCKYITEQHQTPPSTVHAENGGSLSTKYVKNAGEWKEIWSDRRLGQGRWGSLPCTNTTVITIFFFSFGEEGDASAIRPWLIPWNLLKYWNSMQQTSGNIREKYLTAVQHTRDSTLGQFHYAFAMYRGCWQRRPLCTHFTYTLSVCQFFEKQRLAM